MHQVTALKIILEIPQEKTGMYRAIVRSDYEVEFRVVDMGREYLLKHLSWQSESPR